MSQHVQGLIDELIARVPTQASAAHRVQALRYINNREKKLAQRGSYLYLSQRTTLTLNNGATSVAAPTSPLFDSLKAAAISDDLGELPFYPLGEFDTRPLDMVDVTRTTRPSGWTLAMSGSTLTIFFDRANSSGSNIVYNITYQRTPAELADLNSSFSLLPEGWEKTLLLEGAEMDWKEVLRIPISQKKREDYDALLSAFDSAQLTSKPEAATADEIVARKQYERQLRPGV